MPVITSLVNAEAEAMLGGEIAGVEVRPSTSMATINVFGGGLLIVGLDVSWHL